MSVHGFNLKNTGGYAELIRKAEPTYIEAKAYMHVGFSRRCLGYDGTPSHNEMREFSTLLARETSYNLIDESIDSRVVLLSKLQRSIRLSEG